MATLHSMEKRKKNEFLMFWLYKFTKNYIKSKNIYLLLNKIAKNTIIE